MAMVTILLANFAHAPVSTTHIVSSSVAGTMVADQMVVFRKRQLIQFY